MKKYISSIKSFVKSINKQKTKEFMFVHKNALIVMLAIVLLGGIITAASYAYYQTLANQSIVGGQVGTISNINMYVYVEDKNESTGAGLGTYSRSVYVPQYAYTYNSSLSYCKKGSTLSYNASTYTFTVSNTKDACYAYFDVSESKNADIVLNIYTKKNGEFKLINEVPNNAELYNGLSSCTNGATMTLDNGEITVNTTNKTICNAYLKPYYGPYVYWNGNFTTSAYAYPNVPSTTYSSLESLMNNYSNFSSSPIYIKKGSVKNEVCLYYNNKELCLDENYWLGDGETSRVKVQAEMDSIFGVNVISCSGNAIGTGCTIGTYQCHVYANYTICDTGSGSLILYCKVYSNGSAECNYDQSH